MDKATLRKEIRTAKKAVPFYDKLNRSIPIMQQVAQLPQFVAATTVLLYWSMDDEVQTHDFVNQWYNHKRILLPCIDGDQLLLRQFTGPQSLVPGPQFGIPEPVGPQFTDLDKIDLIIVPGVAFDRNGNRMGRGRGFYDRLLKTTPSAYKIGVAFNFQVFDSIPIDPFDIPIDKVITEPTTAQTL